MADSKQSKRRKQLEERRKEVKEQHSRAERRSSTYVVLGVICLVFTPIIVALFPTIRLLGLYPGFYGLMLLGAGVAMRQRVRLYSEQITDLSNELDLLDLADDKREFRATKLLQVNQVDLRRYYDQTLRQGNQIFYVGLLCILIGFTVVGAAFWLVQGDELKDLSDKIVVATLGAVSGILANFIAVIYLKMFTKTIESVGTFHERLALRDRLNFGNILAAKIGSDTARDATLHEMAVKLAEARKAEGEGASNSNSDAAAIPATAS
jgi:hypothetical protein